ncbi:MAG TPA: hypothetical protein ENJ62_04100 [Bryobacterales bacterium]|nr:hypothetical protein [Bryobacterales bacterium]
MKLIFDSAQILGIEHVIKDAALVTHVKMAGQPTQEALELLDIQGTAWEPLKSAALTWEIGALRLRFTVPQLEQYALDLRAKAAENWKLVRRSDDDGPFIELQFRVIVSGDPVRLVETFHRIGDAKGRLELVPAQKDLFSKPADGVELESVSVQVPPPALRVPVEVEKELAGGHGESA